MFLEDNNDIKPLFVYSDKDVCLHKCISVKTIEDLLKPLYPETAKIKRQYAGSYKFKDANKGSFYALIRIINNSVDSVLHILDSISDIEDYCTLLIDENTVNSRTYKTFEFIGTLEE